MPSDLVLWAAGRAGPDGGLFRLVVGPSSVRVDRVVTVADPVALARHPRLPVVYAVTVGAGLVGRLHAWSVVDGRATALGRPVDVGLEPCSVAVDAAAGHLAVAAYESGEVLVHELAADGSVAGLRHRVGLAGSGPDVERQGSAHPHQVSFDDAGGLRVVDLGADVVRTLDVRTGRQVGAVPVPAGSGPRHLAWSTWPGTPRGAVPGGPDGSASTTAPPRGAVLSAELSGQVLVAVGHGWSALASTRRTGPARTRSARSYPGDVAVHPVAGLGYVANRGHDTVGVVDVAAAELVDELDAGVAWPQHLFVAADRLLVAGQDSSTVSQVPLDPATGRPTGPAVPVADVPGAGWLLAGW